MTLIVGIVTMLAMVWLMLYQPKQEGWGKLFSIMLVSCSFPVMIIV